MKALIRFIVMVFIGLTFHNVQAQNKFTIKTTEEYEVKAPASLGEFEHGDIYMIWVFDMTNKKITYSTNGIKYSFNFINAELNNNSSSDKTIYNFTSRDESLTLIVKEGNYLKIKLYSKKIPESKPVSYENIKVYSNYSINNGLVGILDE